MNTSYKIAGQALLIFLVMITTQVFGDTSGDYRTRNSGNWTDATAWQENTANKNQTPVWVDYNINMSLNFPQSENNIVIIIRSNHTITLTDNLTVHGNGLKIIIEDGGHFVIAHNATINLSGNNATLEIDGDLEVNGEINFNENNGILTGTGVIYGEGEINGNPSFQGTIGSTLPIELHYFTVSAMTNSVMLQWETLAEINNDYFTLERSVDVVNWETIGIVTGAGNSNFAIKYTFEDINPNHGVSYYRLTQTDFDGEFEIFSPVAAYWNPQGNLTYVMYDLMGTILKQGQVSDIYNHRLPRMNRPVIIVYFNNGIPVKTIKSM